MSVNYQQQDYVAILKLNRPEKRNALNSETVENLIAQFDKIECDKNIHCILICAEGNAFCAGSDLKELGGLTPENMAKKEKLKSLLCEKITTSQKLIICAVEGYALGGGFAFAAACDIIVSSKTARWHMPEVQNGWIPPWGLSLVSARVGPVQARKLAWGLTAINAEYALSIGLVDHLSEENGSFEMGLQLAEQYAKFSPYAIASVKRFFSTEIGKDLKQKDDHCSQEFIKNCQHDTAVHTLNKFRVNKA